MWHDALCCLATQISTLVVVVRMNCTRQSECPTDILETIKHFKTSWTCVYIKGDV